MSGTGRPWRITAIRGTTARRMVVGGTADRRALGGAIGRNPTIMAGAVAITVTAGPEGTRTPTANLDVATPGVAATG
jgi:hypothetical protein